MAIDENDPRLVYMKEEKLIKPKAGRVLCYLDAYWIVHPDKGVLFWKSTPKAKYLAPQCNQNVVAETIKGRLYPWATVKQIPQVFIVDDAEYC
jgi:hypothetical protein